MEFYYEQFHGRMSGVIYFSQGVSCQDVNHSNVQYCRSILCANTTITIGHDVHTEQIIHENPV